jgi:hypothetical protein
MPPRSRTNPKDFTGQQKAKLAEAHHTELLERKDKIAMLHQAEYEAMDVAVELDSYGNEIRRDVSVEDLAPMDLAPNLVEIRVNCDIENATIGYGTLYNFKEGQKYKVTPDVASWLDYLGYVWH